MFWSGSANFEKEVALFIPLQIKGTQHNPHRVRPLVLLVQSPLFLSRSKILSAIAQ